MNKKAFIFGAIAVALSIFIINVLIGIQYNKDKKVDYDFEADVASVEKYDKVLRVAGGTDFSPFAFYDENGKPCGHDVELMFAIGRELGYRVEITLGDWTEMQEGILNNKYDILMTVDYSEGRSKIMGYTSPVYLDSYVFFGKSKSIKLDDINDLKKLKIAALKGGGSTDNYLKPLGLDEKTKFYDTQLEAFKAVENGICDVAIAGYTYGSNVIASNDMNLIQVGSPLYESAYYFTYNINNTEFGPLLNSALASLDTKGITASITDKWVTHYQPNLTLFEFVKNNITDFLIGLLIFIVIIVIGIELFLMYTRKREDKLKEIDPLTTLYNSHSFFNYLRKIMSHISGQRIYMIRFDIDNFKSFNFTQGSEIGDVILKGIGTKLNELNKTDGNILLVGYLGSDDFVVILKECTYTHIPLEFRNLLISIIKESFEEYNLSIAMGICEMFDKNVDPVVYSDQAYLALRSTKDDFYKHYAWFDEKMQDYINNEKNIVSKMRKALDDNCFVPYFQPQYDYETKQMCGAEVLARWVDIDGTIIPPMQFIPVFEKNGFIFEMDKVIWEQACKCIKKWKEEGIMIPHLSVNISRADIYHSDIVSYLLSTMRKYDVNFNELHLEITESAYIENSDLLLEIVAKLKYAGAIIEMDDFGSGYSSLASLRDINVDAIKLDMSLIRNNSFAGKDSAILESVVSLGKNMGIEMIAEGVEEKEQADYLASLGCTKMQGYLFSKPINQVQFVDLLKKNKQKLDEK